MALFGSSRDISLFRHLNKELLDRIIEQRVGYYKIDLNKTKNNIYGESLDKYYNDPILVTCLIDRGDKVAVAADMTPTIDKTLTVRFLRDTLVEINLVPEIGDVMLWNENYFEINNVNENQLIVGKDPSYSYESSTDNFGTSLSIIVTANYVKPERFGIKQQRL